MGGSVSACNATYYPAKKKATGKGGVGGLGGGFEWSGASLQSYNDCGRSTCLTSFSNPINAGKTPYEVFSPK
jgi:hypothetical protein